ncbi:MAG: hypothetical protein KC503_31590, partial [Myxococcales bacterium]|nr:hypothetical protein [Myxococcales bacterium]
SRVIVTLEHLDHYLRALQRPSPYGRAARAIAADGRALRPARDLLGETPGGALIDELETLRGVGPAGARLIREMLASGRCAPYEQVLADAGALAGSSTA